MASFWRRWRLCAAFFYPAYLLALAGLYALPGLVQAGALGYRVESVRVWSLDISVRAVNYPEGGAPAVRRAPRVEKPLFAGLLLAGVWISLARRWPRCDWMAGLGLACVAQLALPAVLLPVVRAGGWRWPHALYGAILFGLLVVALRCLTAGFGAPSYRHRAAAGLLLFPLPLVGLWLVAGSPRLLGQEWFWGLQIAPAVLASLVAAVLPQPASASRLEPGWRVVLAGVALTALSASAVQAAREATRGSSYRAARAPLEQASALPSEPVGSPPKFHRGVNFTAESPQGYASPQAEKVLDELAAQGVNAVALVPYGFLPRGSAELRFPGGWERDEAVAYISRLAHARGMAVMLKPQVWFRGGYPGDVKFPDAAQRETFFLHYARFVEHYARLARKIHAEVFCVGVEFVHLTRHEQRWREFFELAREHYEGPLVYAANFGEEFERVAFWDALDYIGLDNYYPLPDDRSMDEIVAKVELVQRRFGKPVLFTEAGFPSIRGGHRRPWDDRFGTLAPEEQAANYEAVLRAFYDKPWFHGVYWWKVGTNGFGGTEDGSHTPWGKPAMEVVERWYRSGRR